MSARIVVKKLEGCARCHGDHEHLEFVRMDRPVMLGPVFDFWSLCPTRGEPVLLCSARLAVDAIESVT